MFTQWYLLRDSGTSTIYAYPAELTGIKKVHGCVAYWPLNDSGARWSPDKWGLILGITCCKKIFGRCPEKGELLYVKQQKNGKWKSESIDLEFSD